MLEGSLLVPLVAVATVALLCVLAATLLLWRSSLLQTRSLQAQLELASDARQSQNLLYALRILRDQEFRSSIMVVRNRMAGRPPESWNAADILHVLNVCSTYNLVGVLIRSEVLSGPLFFEHWGSSVVETWKAIEEFVKKKQKYNPRYCADFEWLFQECLRHDRAEAASGQMPMPQSGTGPLRMSS